MAVHLESKSLMGVHANGAVLGTQKRSIEKITLDPARLIGFASRGVSVGATQRGTEKIGLDIGTSKSGPEKLD